MQEALKSPLVRRRLILSGLVLAVAIAALLLAMRIPRTVTIFAIAAFIALGVHPTVARLERHMRAAASRSPIVFAGLLGALVLFAVLVIPATFEQVQILSGHLPEYLAGDAELRRERRVDSCAGGSAPRSCRTARATCTTYLGAPHDGVS